MMNEKKKNTVRLINTLIYNLIKDDYTRWGAKKELDDLFRCYKR